MKKISKLLFSLLEYNERGKSGGARCPKLLLLLFAVIFTAAFIVLQGHNKRDVSIFIVGDILLDRGVGEKTDLHGSEYPYLIVKNILPKADIAFGNLECPITDGGIPALKRPYYLFRGGPNDAKALKECGFDILNLANNHTMDYGRKGIIDTISILGNNNIKTIGAGKNSKLARKPVFIEVSGNVIGFLGYSAFPSEGYTYLANKPDVAQVDLSRLAHEVKGAKSRCDILIVSFHWGYEFENYPSESQKETAHMAIENGADIIVGHHPHVLQGMEFYMDKPIFYSIGNFIFDRQEQKGTDETIILGVKIIDKRIVALDIAPIKIIECQPCIPEDAETIKILDSFQEYSRVIDSDIEVDKKGKYVISDSTFFPIKN